MKKKHYQNVGFPRSGTSWAWQSLVNHPDIFKSTNFIKTRNFTNNNKEPKFGTWTSEKIENRIPVDVTPILEKYNEYDISLCFNTFDFLCTSEEIQRIEAYTTHASLTLRNPYEVVSNYYVYHKAMFPKKDYTVNELMNMFDFSNTVERWLSFKNKFKVFVYDDLLQDQHQYYKDICDFIEVESKKDVPKKINSIDIIID